MFRNIKWSSVLWGVLAGVAGTRLIRTEKAKRIAEGLAEGGYIAREFILEESEQAQTWISDAAAVGKERAEQYIGRAVTSRTEE